MTHDVRESFSFLFVSSLKYVTSALHIISYEYCTVTRTNAEAILFLGGGRERAFSTCVRQVPKRYFDIDRFD